MSKRIIALCLLAAMLLSMLAACGDDEDVAATESPTNIHTAPADAGRTLFIYMCGSNLETKQGLAGKNIDELLRAEVGDSLNIVLQTGGAKTWRSHGISSSASQRYEVKNGKLVLLETLDQRNMGDPETLTDFLTWGQDHYPTEQNMLILWDHGGGAVKGLCFDENYGFDAMTLSDLRKALENAKLKRKFDIIGFDACLMASIETAAMVRDYAEYMIASQEIEPSGGWNYQALPEAFASQSDMLSVSKIICDSYMEKCKSKGVDSNATLSVFDLSRFDKMMVEFIHAMEVVHQGFLDKNTSSEMIHAMKNCAKFGGNNAIQGTSNMLDLIDVFLHAPNIPGDLTSLWGEKIEFVPYYVCGEATSAYGVSFYYPFRYDEREIRSYIDLGVCEAYNDFLSSFFLRIPKTTVEYTNRGSLFEDGAFTVSFSQNSVYYLASVEYLLMTTDESGAHHILFEDNDLTFDQETMTYHSNPIAFRPVIYDRPFFFVVDYRSYLYGEELVEYSAPIILNGKRTILHFDYYCKEEDNGNGRYNIYGTWSGYDENGMPVMDFQQTQKGDKVQVISDVVIRDGKPYEILSEEFELMDDDWFIFKAPLDQKTYQYIICASDLFDKTFTSDMATFELIDGAYQVTKSEPYSTKIPKLLYCSTVC